MTGDRPTSNPYAHDARVTITHRVYETLARRLSDLSRQLVEAGYSPRQVSQAELLQMILHNAIPTLEDAAEQLQNWAMLQAAPPPPKTTSRD